MINKTNQSQSLVVIIIDIKIKIENIIYYIYIYNILLFIIYFYIYIFTRIYEVKVWVIRSLWTLWITLDKIKYLFQESYDITVYKK